MSKALLTDLRVGLAGLLAAQSVLVDAFTNLGAPAKVVSSIVALIGIVYGVVTAVGEASATGGAAPK